MYYSIEVLHAFYSASSNGVSRAEFRSFVNSHLKHATITPGLQALVWAPVVTDQQRNTFEAQIRSEGFPDFSIVNRVGADQYVVACFTRDEPRDRHSDLLAILYP
ncbi:MAG: hypothetical protein OHK0050_43720 [Roseiflexaceae bacterium]